MYKTNIKPVFSQDAYKVLDIFEKPYGWLYFPDKRFENQVFFWCF